MSGQGKNSKTVKGKGQGPGLFSVLGPYRLIVVILIIMALGGSAINLLVPKIIQRSIDAFTAGSFSATKVITEFLIAAAAIFVFTFPQGILQTITAASVTGLAPLHLPRRTTRSVSYYAFFRWWLLLSQHPDCFSLPTSDTSSRPHGPPSLAYGTLSYQPYRDWETDRKSVV